MSETCRDCENFYLLDITNLLSDGMCQEYECKINLTNICGDFEYLPCQECIMESAWFDEDESPLEE